jgi:hypothetical protein
MRLHNDRQVSHNPKITSAGKAVCPHCQTAFPITWRRYWAAPLGNYRCPKCRQLSHSTANAWWIWLIILVVMTLAGIVGTLLVAYVFPNSWLGAALIFIGYLAIGFTLDKWLDGHLRYLKIHSQ